ncbi:MAG: topoisomerase [Actinomycetota bacterium]|nr:topoisomerase [Actinomycetota bacterium]
MLSRIRHLGIPPAWTDVWICPHPNGHIQAIGTDAAGRKQYLYHDQWRLRRDQEKFDRMEDFAKTLPDVRTKTAEHLALPGMPRERSLACAVRLLDRGFFRVGGESYTDSNGSFGLATIRKDHVTLGGGRVSFEYVAKSGKWRETSVVDRAVLECVQVLKRRRSGGEELLAFKTGARWRDVRSTDINEYLKDLSGGDFSAKDFRTWHATVFASVALAVSYPTVSSKTASKRAISRAVKEVAHYMGNTPAVCRASYIDPRVIDRFTTGVTIGGVLEDLGAVDAFGEPSLQGPVEEAVLDLVAGNRSSPAIEKVA